MARLVTFLLLLLSTPILAQDLKGVVRDYHTHQPIANVQTIGKKLIVLTKEDGQFILTKVKVGDQIGFRKMGYETLEITITEEIIKNGFVVDLKSSVIDLKAVTISGNRNYKQDSLAFRKEFSKEFNYKALGIKDMFSTIDPEYRPPLALRKPNSTSAIASINVLQVFKVFGRTNAKSAKLKDTLLNLEAAQFIDHVFSKALIQSVTKLSGDSLQQFRNRYRPSIAEAKKMNNYEMLLYVKTSYQDYIK